MRELTSETITTAVIEQMATTPDARTKQIMEAAVRHLHAFAREINLTPGEWIQGITFMTKVGQMCTPERQEFILLSDTLGLSTLVNTLHDKTAIEEATNTSLLGPFFREQTPVFESGAQISRHPTSEDEVVLYGQITDRSGRGIAGAKVTVWQTRSDGRYDIQVDGGDIDCRGIFTADANGRYLVRTVRPIGYSIPLDGPVGTLIKAQKRHGMRPAHIHFLISAPGFRELVTATYMSGDVYLESDTVFGASGDLVVDVKPQDAACPIQGLPSMRFDFSMAREGAIDAMQGRVGADPSQITKRAEGETVTASYSGDSAGTPATTKKGGLFGKLLGDK